MTTVTLFISDLHLCAERPAITALFLQFLRTEARAAQTLYILGDLFEFWAGDEVVELDEFRPIVEGIRALSANGVPVYAMHGNRDFLMGARFEHASGCRLLPEPTRIELYGSPVLLMHGDSLCTRDTEYMRFRSMVRDLKWQRDFLAKPLTEREAIIREYRKISMANTAAKKPEIMDVTQDAVEETMRTQRVRHLIHGHTHRPAEHRFTLDGAPAARTVLGDWYERGRVLRVVPGKQMLEPLPLPEN
jgi:UDP-2,3-diacylglucosamine hydrolase